MRISIKEHFFKAKSHCNFMETLIVILFQNSLHPWDLQMICPRFSLQIGVVCLSILQIGERLLGLGSAAPVLPDWVWINFRLMLIGEEKALQRSQQRTPLNTVLDCSKARTKLWAPFGQGPYLLLSLCFLNSAVTDLSMYNARCSVNTLNNYGSFPPHLSSKSALIKHL